VSELTLDPAKSKIRIRTFAEGLFARLAHDLELHAKTVSGTATKSADKPDKASIDVDVYGIAVAGVLKDGHVDERGLSPGDKNDCLDKMRREVFKAKAGDVVHVEAFLDGTSARIEIVPPNGRKVERKTTVEVREDGGQIFVKGKVELSLAAIGSDRVKGPMNAFRVKDVVEVLFDLSFG